MIIGDILAPFPQLAGIPERVMLLKDLKTEDGQPVPDPDPGRSDEADDQRPLPAAASTMQPGQLEFWRIGNIGSNIYYQLTLGEQPFHVIAQDGNLQNQVVTTDTLILAARQAARGAGVRPAAAARYQLRGGGLQHRAGRATTTPASCSAPSSRADRRSRRSRCRRASRRSPT